MTTIAVASVKGAGGVTSAALVLAAVRAETDDVMLVEADPSGGSLLGWCEQLRPAGDLYDLAMSRNSAGLASVAQQMGDLSVVPSWGRSFRLTQALIRPRVPWAVLLGGFDGTRHRRCRTASTRRRRRSASWRRATSSCSSPPSEPAPVATTMEWASRGGRHGPADVGMPVGRLRMITSEVVGRRRTMSVTPRDLSLVTGAGYLGHLPHDPASLESAVPRCVDRATGGCARRPPRRSSSSRRRRRCRRLRNAWRWSSRCNGDRIGTARRPRPTGRSDPPRIRGATPGRAAAGVARRTRGAPGEDEVRPRDRGDAADQRGAGAGVQPGAAASSRRIASSR